MALEARRKAERDGRWAEFVAAWFLRLKGYSVIDRRYRTAVGEIDLIVRRGSTIVFVEVKRRLAEAAALEAVTATARARIARAAAVWVSVNAGTIHLDHRFDVVLVLPGRIPRHLEAVFDSDGAVW